MRLSSSRGQASRRRQRPNNTPAEFQQLVVSPPTASMSTTGANEFSILRTTDLQSSHSQKTHRALEKVKKLLSKAWNGWYSQELSMGGPFLLSLAQKRSVLGNEDAPFSCPSLVRASQRPENAYSVHESERRVHILIGEAILETLILITLKRLNTGMEQISRAAECKTRIVRCLSKHGFKSWSTLTTETESILRFKRTRSKHRGGSDDVPQPMGVMTPRYRPDVNVTLHRSGSVDMTMLFESRQSKHKPLQTTTTTQEKATIDTETTEIKDATKKNEQKNSLAATNQRLLKENQRLSKERERLMDGLDRASEHILSSKKKKRGVGKGNQ